MRYSIIGLIIAVFCITVVMSVAEAAEKKTFPLSPGASCITTDCHAVLAKKKYVHAAAADGSGCVVCHMPSEKERHAFQAFPANAAELCRQCHETKDTGKQIHPPVQEGQCVLCHDPHQADQPKLLTTPLPELCFMCHDPSAFQGKTRHGPVAEGRCTGCHNPHASNHGRLLAAQAPELCFTCHGTQVKDRRGTMLPPTKSLFEDKESALHPPFAAGECGSCHLPHASTSSRLLTGEYPSGFYVSYAETSYGLCFTCHSGKAFTEPRTLTETEFRNGNLNLHYRHVNRTKGRACGACHNPHGSRQPKLVRQTFAFGKRTLPLAYEKTETGGGCATACHAPVKYDRCEPEDVTLRTTPREGKDAAGEALRKACGPKK